MCRQLRVLIFMFGLAAGNAMALCEPPGLRQPAMENGIRDREAMQFLRDRVARFLEERSRYIDCLDAQDNKAIGGIDSNALRRQRIDGYNSAMSEMLEVITAFNAQVQAFNTALDAGSRVK
jgi:hypothetical protein